MKSLRNIAYTIVLSLAALSLAAGSAAAQSARGAFTLPHSVMWQTASVPAGEYEFSLDPKGPSQLMTLRQLDGSRVSFMLLVHNTAPALSGNIDRLVLVSREGKSFVQSLELPNYGLTLHFNVPSESTDKELALAGDHPEPTRSR
jgi:hypothetical protein